MLLIIVVPIEIPAQDIPNGNFEIWANNVAGIIEPENWETQNELGMVFVNIAKGHTGEFAACLCVVWDSMLQKFTGATMTTSGFVSINGRIKYLKGFCKGGSNNSDSLKVDIGLFSKNGLVAEGSSYILREDYEWEQFAVAINYCSDEEPSKMKISFSVVPLKGSHFQTTYCIDDLIISE